MPKIHPNPSADSADSADLVSVVPVSAASAAVPKPRLRRESTLDRIHALSDSQRVLAETFRPLSTPTLVKCLIWTLGTCISMQLLFAVPYAQNERSLNSTAIRGMLIGIPVAYFEAGLFMTEIAILVRGAFHWRFVLSIPISVCCALAFAFVPVGDSLLGLCSVAFLAVAATYLLAHHGRTPAADRRAENAL